MCSVCVLIVLIRVNVWLVCVLCVFRECSLTASASVNERGREIERLEGKGQSPKPKSTGSDEGERERATSKENLTLVSFLFFPLSNFATFPL